MPTPVYKTKEIKIQTRKSRNPPDGNDEVLEKLNEEGKEYPEDRIGA